VTALHPHIAPPVGRIHFAGEHTTTVEPGLEAAFESAERVTWEIVAG
jgi:monoamine oxidase